MPIFILALETCDKGTIIETKSNINKIPLLSRVNFKLEWNLFDLSQIFSSSISLYVQMKKLPSVYFKQIEVLTCLL